MIYSPIWQKRRHLKETGFDKLARLIKGEGEDIRVEMGAMEKRFDGRIDKLDRKVDEGFTSVQSQLDTIIQIQVDQHATICTQAAPYPKGAA